MPVKPMMLVPDVPSEKNALRYRKTPSTSSSNDGSFDCHQPFKVLTYTIMYFNYVHCVLLLDATTRYFSHDTHMQCK